MQENKEFVAFSGLGGLRPSAEAIKSPENKEIVAFPPRNAERETGRKVPRNAGHEHPWRQ